MKIHYDLVQGTPEWLQARAGKVTASNLDRIVTPKDWKPSKQAEGYLDELLAEHLIGGPIDSASNAYMERGRRLEDEGRDWFEFQHGIEVQQVGGVESDDAAMWCSPDGLIDDDGGLEIKTPGLIQHVANTRRPEAFIADHWPQVQGGLYVTGRAFWWLVSYNPVLPSVAVRVERNDEFIGILHDALYEENGFLSRLEAAKEAVKPQ